MGKNFFSEAGALAVTQLAKETKRKFRLGTPLEALAYKKANLPHPTYFTVLSKVFSVHVLYWRDWGGDPGFNLDAWVSCWSSNCGVFVVEDPE